MAGEDLAGVPNGRQQLGPAVGAGVRQPGCEGDHRDRPGVRVEGGNVERDVAAPVRGGSTSSWSSAATRGSARRAADSVSAMSAVESITGSSCSRVSRPWSSTEMKPRSVPLVPERHDPARSDLTRAVRRRSHGLRRLEDAPLLEPGPDLRRCAASENGCHPDLVGGRVVVGIREEPLAFVVQHDLARQGGGNAAEQRLDPLYRHLSRLDHGNPRHPSIVSERCRD